MECKKPIYLQNLDKKTLHVPTKNNQGTIILGGFLLVFAVILVFSFSAEHTIHEIFHGVTFMMSLYLSFLSFGAFYRYRISRILFAAIAFAIFGASEVIEMVDDLESHDEPWSLDEIRDYVIFAAITLFAIGTFYKTRFNS